MLIVSGDLSNECPIGDVLRHNDTWMIYACDRNLEVNCPDGYYCRQAKQGLPHDICCTKGEDKGKQIVHRSHSAAMIESKQVQYGFNVVFHRVKTLHAKRRQAK